MLKRLCCLAAGVVLCSVATVNAAPAPLPWGWAVVANQGNGLGKTEPGFIGESIFTVDLTGATPVIHGPFLSGQLSPLDPITGEITTGGGVFDVTQIPGTKDVLISNFGFNTIYRVSLADPTNPAVVGSVEIDFFAEDIVVTKNGKEAFVTDGGFSPKVAFIDVETMTHTTTVPLHEGPAYDPENPPDPLPADYSAQSVDVTPDGQTLVFADYFAGAVTYGKINSTRDGFDSLNQLHLCPNWNATDEKCGPDDYMPRPVNLAISPDGRTVVANDAGWGMVSILRIDGPGVVVPGTPFQLWGLPNTYEDYYKYENNDGSEDTGHFYKSSSQSTVFAPNGDRAYILQNGTSANVWDGDSWATDTSIPNKLSYIKIDGPGQASVGGVWVAELFCDSGSQLFGVDTLAIDKFGQYAYASNPTMSGASGSITRVDLTTFATKEIRFDPAHPFDPDPYNYVNPDALPVGLTVMRSPFNWSMFMSAAAFTAAP